MTAAYVDTSCLVAVAFGEPNGEAVAAELAKFEHRFSANLLEAELRAACAREHVDLPDGFLGSISWLHPDRPLSDEIEQVLSEGYLRGADLWHVAAALFLDEGRGELVFLTLDESQRRVAERLGLRQPDDPYA